MPTSDPSRPMLPIPIAMGALVANGYGYDQVVIMARRVGDTEPNGEHITTYGVNKAHCDVAALMGSTLQRIAGWPDAEDVIVLRELLEDLSKDAFNHDDHLAAKREAALARLLGV